MKFIEGNKYLYEKYNIELIYTGNEKQMYFTCDNCGREINNLHFFCVGDPCNPSEVYKFGSECVKKCIVKI